jgi:hypothetical protein
MTWLSCAHGAQIARNCNEIKRCHWNIEAWFLGGTAAWHSILTNATHATVPLVSCVARSIWRICWSRESGLLQDVYDVSYCSLWQIGAQTKITSLLMDLVHPIRLFIICRPRLSTWINLVHLSGSKSTGQRHHLGKKTGADMADIQAGKYRPYMPYIRSHICIIRNVVNSTIAITNLHMSTNGRYHDSSWPIPLKRCLIIPPFADLITDTALAIHPDTLDAGTPIQLRCLFPCQVRKVWTICVSCAKCNESHGYAQPLGNKTNVISTLYNKYPSLILLTR